MFFEPINVSATHIYHSALELTSLSSIIRKLHYHRRPTPLPRVVYGIPESRDPSISIPSRRSFRESCSWSPCGRFVAIRVEDAVMIRDALTFELVSTLKLFHPPFIGATPLPSYSPDGKFLGCTDIRGITIWDIQTGGVAKRIPCYQSDSERFGRLVWSSCGRLVGVLSDRTIRTFDVASGTALPPIRLDSYGAYLWAHNESFRVMTRNHHSRSPMDIFDVVPALTEIESFLEEGKYKLLTFPATLIRIESFLEEGKYKLSSFSPITYHISGSVQNPAQLVILDLRTGKILLNEEGIFNSDSHMFSPNGNRFVASQSASILVWNYDGAVYIPWRQFPFPIDHKVHDIIFSPTSSSILVTFHDTIRLWRLDKPTISSATRTPQLEISSDTHVATARYQGRTITITNFLLPATSQFIDTSLKITGIGFTGNVLLVKGTTVVAAWLLTEEGRVSNAGNKRASYNNRIWTMSVSQYSCPKFSVGGGTGLIKSGNTLRFYNSTTGEVLNSAQASSRFNGPWYFFHDSLQAHDHCSNPPEEWKPSVTTGTNGWLKDHQGKCLLWLPTEWRNWNMEWLPDILTMKLISRDEQPIVIKLLKPSGSRYGVNP